MPINVERKIGNLEDYERDNTKSCSSKSPRISSHNTNFGGNDQILAQNEISNYGSIKDMIQMEIVRLQSLYQNIDSLIEAGKGG